MASETHIPLRDLVEWHDEETQQVIREEADLLKRSLQSHGTLDQHLGFNAAIAVLSGKKEELNGFAAFLLTRTLAPECVPDHPSDTTEQ